MLAWDVYYVDGIFIDDMVFYLFRFYPLCDFG